MTLKNITLRDSYSGDVVSGACAGEWSLRVFYFKGGVKMILSYKDIFEPKAKRTRIKAEISTEHSASSYGKPVIVLPDGGALDLMSWVAMDYRVEKATKEEKLGLQKIGLI